MTSDELQIRRDVATLARTAYWLLNRGVTKRDAAFDIEQCVWRLNRLAGDGAWTGDELRQLLGHPAAVSPEAPHA